MTWQWMIIFFSVAAIFSFAMVVKTSEDEEAFTFDRCFLFFWNVGQKVTPLLGPSQLLTQPNQDMFDFIFLQVLLLTVLLPTSYLPTSHLPTSHLPTSYLPTLSSFYRAITSSVG